MVVEHKHASMNVTQVELPGVGWLYSEGRAEAHLQLEQQLLERLALKSPLVSNFNLLLLLVDLIACLATIESPGCCGLTYAPLSFIMA